MVAKGTRLPRVPRKQRAAGEAAPAALVVPAPLNTIKKNQSSRSLSHQYHIFESKYILIAKSNL